ncbi:MAG: ribonuclease E/G [Ignavibacteria bacterium]
MPGRYLVLIPFEKKIGLSKKIYNPKEKRKTEKYCKIHLTKGIWLSDSSSRSDESLILDDLNTLIKTWNEIQSKLKTSGLPSYTSIKMYLQRHQLSEISLKKIFPKLLLIQRKYLRI